MPVQFQGLQLVLTRTTTRERAHTHTSDSSKVVLCVNPKALNQQM